MKGWKADALSIKAKKAERMWGEREGERDRMFEKIILITAFSGLSLFLKKKLDLLIFDIIILWFKRKEKINKDT